jgi:6,7-dimethyl-8-ribityllumazine synthase
MLSEPTRILVIEARFHERIADELLGGATAALNAGRAEFSVVQAPGALEIPAILAMAEEGGHRAAGVRYDGYVVLGCILRAGSYHFELVANESARGLTDLAIGRRLAIGNGVLAAEDEGQALAMARPRDGDAGGAAARACLAVIDVRRRLLGQVR